MANFHFSGRNQQGGLIEGRRESISADALSATLIAEGITPIDISLARTKLALQPFWFTTRGISNEDILVFCQQMNVLLTAGIPLLTAVTRMAEITPNPKLKTILFEISDSLNQGMTLSTALQNYPNIFNPIIANLIHVGEESGKLSEVFAEIVKYLTFEDATKRRLQAALRYPLTVLVFITLGFIIINVFVLPNFIKLYSKFNIVLPLPTRILMGISSFMTHHGMLLLILIFMFGYGFYLYFETPDGRFNIDKKLLRIPVFGKILDHILLVRVTSTLALISHAGIPLINGLNLVAESTRNTYLKKSLLELRESLIHGESLSRAAQRVNLFSPILVQMLMIGEETGAIDSVLFQVAAYYESMIDYEVKHLADKIEPIMLMFTAGLVVILALGVFLPMWDMVKIIRQ